MNKLTTEKRAKIIRLLVEGTSLRSISRVEDVSINTVSKLLVEAGNACVDFHNNYVRDVKARRIQVDEIWQFCYAKEKNVPDAKAAPEGAGDTWTWTAIDADSKLIVSWLLGERDSRSAYHFIADLAERLTDRVQLTSDGNGLSPIFQSRSGAARGEAAAEGLRQVVDKPFNTVPHSHIDLVGFADRVVDRPHQIQALESRHRCAFALWPRRQRRLSESVGRISSIE